MKNSNDTIWKFFCTVFLYWSRYRLYICQSILSKQSFAGFMSRYLAAGGVASDASCLPIGSSSLCSSSSSFSSSSWDGAVCCVAPMQFSNSLMPWMNQPGSRNFRKHFLFISRVSTLVYFEDAQVIAQLCYPIPFPIGLVLGSP